MKKTNKKIVRSSLRVPQRSRSVPTGVKIISILYYILAVITIFVGIVFLIGAGFIAGNIPESQVLSTIGQAGLTIVSIVAIILGILIFLLGMYLWRGKNWARIIVIILSVLGAISALTALIQGHPGRIVNLIIHVVIGAYLIFSKEVKASFR